MKHFNGALFGTLVFVLALLAPHACRAEPAESITGELMYVPQPDIYICFCGTYPLIVESGQKIVYLVAPALDLSIYVGARVNVTGRSFTALCSGTLAHPCDYLAVEKIAVATSADVEGASWGAIKSLYP